MTATNKYAVACEVLIAVGATFSLASFAAQLDRVVYADKYKTKAQVSVLFLCLYIVGELVGYVPAAVLGVVGSTGGDGGGWYSLLISNVLFTILFIATLIYTLRNRANSRK